VSSSSGRVVLPPSCRGRGVSVRDQGPLSRAAWVAAGKPDESALLVPGLIGSSPVGRMSSHQAIDGDPAPAAEITGGESGELGHIGQGHAEDSCRVEHSGVGDHEAVSGRLGESSG